MQFNQRGLFLLCIFISYAGSTANAASPFFIDTTNNYNLTGGLSLEDLENYAATAVQGWVQFHRDRTRKYLDSNPLLPEIKTRFSELKATAPPLRTQFSGTYGKMPARFYAFIDDNSLKLSVDNSPPRTLVDAKSLPPKSAVVAFKISPNLKTIAYGYAEGGSDWQTWKVVSVPEDADHEPVVSDSSFATNWLTEVNWNNESDGLYYTYWGDHQLVESAAPERSIQVRLHRLRTPKSTSLSPDAADIVIYEDPERPHFALFSAQDTQDGRILVYRLQGSAEIPQASFLLSKQAALAGKTQIPTALVPPYKYVSRFLGTANKLAYFRSNDCGNASEINDFYCIISIHLDTLKKNIVIPAAAGQVLLQAALSDQWIVTQYFSSAPVNAIDITDPKLFASRIEAHGLSGNFYFRLNFSDYGLFPVGIVNLSTSLWSQSIDVSLSNYLDGVVAFRIDLPSRQVQQLNSRIAAFDKTKIKVEVREYESNGKMIPIHIFSRKDIAETDKHKFAYMLYYGAVGTPNFQIWTRKTQMMLELGGLVAAPYGRGGGEFGNEWQRYGSENKMITFEDIANASRFVRSKYNIELDNFGKKRLVGHGRSYGGWHTFSQMALFNDDFSAFIPGVPGFDYFHSISRGVAWWIVDDFSMARTPLLNGYGGILDFAREMERFKKWDLISNLDRFHVAKPTIIYSGDHDTRTKPTQAYRGAWTLFEKFKGNGDDLIYLLDYKDTGHISRPEPLDEITWVSLVFGIKELSPLKH